MLVETEIQMPKPKFSLGQRVTIPVPMSREEVVREGIVVGVTYHSPVRALKDRKDHQGWEYKVSLNDAKPLSEVVY